MRHDRLLHGITEGKMRRKPITGKRRIQMLHDFANDDGYVSLKWTAEGHRRTETQRKDVTNVLQRKRLSLSLSLSLSGDESF